MCSCRSRRNEVEDSRSRWVIALCSVNTWRLVRSSESDGCSLCLSGCWNQRCQQHKLTRSRFISSVERLNLQYTHLGFQEAKRRCETGVKETRLGSEKGGAEGLQPCRDSDSIIQGEDLADGISVAAPPTRSRAERSLPSSTTQVRNENRKTTCQDLSLQTGSAQWRCRDGPCITVSDFLAAFSHQHLPQPTASAWTAADGGAALRTWLSI